MSPAQQMLDYQEEINEKQQSVNEMVMDSYRDFMAEKDIAEQIDYA